MARGLEFRIKEVEGLYYPIGYREADLRLCFRICKTLVFHDAAHILNSKYTEDCHRKVCLRCIMNLSKIVYMTLKEQIWGERSIKRTKGKCIKRKKGNLRPTHDFFTYAFSILCVRGASPL